MACAIVAYGLEKTLTIKYVKYHGPTYYIFYRVPFEMVPVLPPGLVGRYIILNTPDNMVWVWTKCIPGEVFNGIYTMDGSLPTYVQAWDQVKGHNVWVNVENSIATSFPVSLVIPGDGVTFKSTDSMFCATSRDEEVLLTFNAITNNNHSLSKIPPNVLTDHYVRYTFSDDNMRNTYHTASSIAQSIEVMNIRASNGIVAMLLPYIDSVVQQVDDVGYDINE